MNSETLVALGLFSIATSITPGPNNIMLLASGVNFGFRRTLPHTLGISIGFCILKQANNAEAHKPMTFLQAALFQWVNPKAWVMAVSSMALYTSASRPYFSVFMVAAIFSVLNWPSCSTWAVFGQALKGFLSDSARLKWFNIAMGSLLAASVVLIIK